MNDIITKEQVLNAYNKASDLVRAVFNDEETTQVIVALETKFGLHSEDATTLAKEVGYLLLGITDPNTFVSRLKGNHFPDQTINEITAEINQKIFMPLRDQVQTEGESMEQSARSATTPPSLITPQPRAAPSRPPTFAPAPKASSMPPQSVIIQANPSLPQHPAQVAASMMRYTPVPKQPPKPISSRLSTPIQGQAPSMDASKMVEDHEEPSPSVRMMPSAIPAALKPPQREYTPPANLPGMMPVPAMPNIIRRPVTNNTPPPPVPLTPKPPRPPMESYSSDPYREPVDQDKHGI